MEHGFDHRLSDVGRWLNEQQRFIANDHHGSLLLLGHVSDKRADFLSKPDGELEAQLIQFRGGMLLGVLDFLLALLKFRRQFLLLQGCGMDAESLAKLVVILVGSLTHLLDSMKHVVTELIDFFSFLLSSQSLVDSVQINDGDFSKATTRLCA